MITSSTHKPLISSLTDKPSAHTVMEWVFAAMIPSLYKVAQQTGLLEECAKGHIQIETIAAQLQLSERGVSALIRSFYAAGIIAQEESGAISIQHDQIGYYIRHFQAVEALARSLQQDLFYEVEEDGSLPEHAPRELSSLGITEIIGERQVLTAAGRRYFTPGQDYFVGNYVGYAWKFTEVLCAGLSEAVKTGRPLLKADDNPGFFAPVVPLLFPMHHEAAEQLADYFNSKEHIHTLLEVGPGSAVWSIELAKRNPDLHIDALDFPLVLNTTKAFTQKYGVYDHYTFYAGDFRALEQETYGTYDLIYANYMADGFSADQIRELFTLCERHLRPGGSLVAAGFLGRPDWTGPLRDVLFSVLMVCLTDDGNTYCAADYESWCHDAGLEHVQWLQVPASLAPILIARKGEARTSGVTQTEQAEQAPSDTPSSVVAADPSFLAPSAIVETNFAFAQSCILLAAVELRLFTHIARGARSAKQLAERAAASQPALERLLDALCAMNFLSRQADAYTLTPISERYLVQDRETYIGDVALQTRQEWDAWINLTRVVQSGEAVRYVNEEPRGGRFFAPLVPHLFPLIYPLMRTIFTRLEVGTQLYGAQVLDIGAGTAPASIAALELDPDARATVIDFPQVLEQARIQAQKHGVEDRITFAPGDLATATFPAAQFDIAIASHIFRILGPEMTQRLIKQCLIALKPGGCFVIVETYNEPEQSEKLFPHIISLNMLVNTRHGDALASRHLRQWLCDAGFEVEAWEKQGSDPILIATRPWSSSGVLA